MTSRRHFLQGLSSSLLTLPLLNHPLTACAAPEQSRKLGIALVGLGSYATNQLAPALQQTKNCHLAGIVTGTPAKEQEWMKKYNIPKENVYDYKTFDRIRDNKAIDVVYVVLPNSMHAEYVIRAAKAGKHVICEKPLAIYEKECREMIDACKGANRQLAVGYRLHYEPFNLELIRMARSEEFGKIKLLEASFGFRSGDPNQWRLKKAMAGGGPMMDVGIYCIQGVRRLVGAEPVSITAQFAPKTDPQKFRDVEETMYWQMEFPNGVTSNSTTSYNANVERLFAACERGFMELSPAYGYGPLKGRTSKGPLEQPVVNHQAAHMDGVCEVLLQNKPLPAHITGEEGLQDVKIMQAAYRAAETGRKISL